MSIAVYKVLSPVTSPDPQTILGGFQVIDHHPHFKDKNTEAQVISPTQDCMARCQPMSQDPQERGQKDINRPCGPLTFGEINLLNSHIRGAGLAPGDH